MLCITSIVEISKKSDVSKYLMFANDMLCYLNIQECYCQLLVYVIPPKVTSPKATLPLISASFS